MSFPPSSPIPNIFECTCVPAFGVRHYFSLITYLRNRYLHINPTEEWSVQPNLTGDTRQVPDKYPTSNPIIERVVLAISKLK